jgi:nickel transport protein
MLRSFPMRCCLPALAGSAALLLTPLAVRAHGIESSLERLDALRASNLRLDSSFSTGEPVAAAAVRLVSPDGRTSIDLGRTDATGQLTFALPKLTGAGWELQVDGGPGHRDYLELPTVSAAPSARSTPGFALARELRQMGRLLPVKGLTGAVGIGALGLGGLGLGLGARFLSRQRR